MIGVRHTAVVEITTPLNPTEPSTMRLLADDYENMLNEPESAGMSLEYQELMRNIINNLRTAANFEQKFASEKGYEHG